MLSRFAGQPQIFLLTEREEAILAACEAIAKEYNSVIEVAVTDKDHDVYLIAGGKRVCIGSITDILSMTLRGLIGIFEGATQAWRIIEGEK